MLNVHNPTGKTVLVAYLEVAFLATVFKRQVVIAVTRNVSLRSPSEVASVATMFKRQVVVAVTGNVGLRVPSEVASIATVFERQVVRVVTGINSWSYEFLKSISRL
jgi:hypothetical protein